MTAPETSTTDNANFPIVQLGNNKPLPSTIPTRSDYVAEFSSNDPLKAMNWPARKRHWIATIVCFGTFVATLDSAIFAPGSAQASSDFGVGQEVGKLGTSLFVLGFAAGPVIWAPWCELMGRRWPLIVGMFGCAVFSVGAATSKDIQTLAISRFFGGVFGASPLCVVPGVLSDIYNDIHRGTAISIYALTVFVGPLAGPFLGGFITTSYLRWRWTLYIPTILGFSNVALLAISLPETYSPILLTSKAAKIRRETGNWCVHAEHERLEFDLREVARKYLTRPVRMLITEPIVLLVSMYMSFVYGILYAFLEAFAYIFGGQYHMSLGLSGLPLIAVIIGVSVAVCFIILERRHMIKKSLAEGHSPEPEIHLLPPIIGAFVFAAGLFWFAWGTLSIWIVPTLAGGFVGFGLLSIFLPCFNYLVDAYLPLTASVVAANIMLRSSIAAGFPLFSTQMYENLGSQWAGTLLGCLATAMIPIPLLFRAYGGEIRSKSKLLASCTSSNTEKKATV